LPGSIIKTFTEDKKYEKLLDEIEKNRDYDLDDEFDYKELGFILGDLSRILAHGAYWLEDTIDDLYSVALFSDYKDIRMNNLDFMFDE